MQVDPPADLSDQTAGESDEKLLKKQSRNRVSVVPQGSILLQLTRSLPAVAKTLPSGLKLQQHTGPSCPRSSAPQGKSSTPCGCVSSLLGHSRTVKSSALETEREVLDWPRRPTEAMGAEHSIREDSPQEGDGESVTRMCTGPAPRLLHGRLRQECGFLYQLPATLPTAAAAEATFLEASLLPSPHNL